MNWMCRNVPWKFSEYFKRRTKVGRTAKHWIHGLWRFPSILPSLAYLFPFSIFFWYCCLLPRPKYLKMAWKIKWNQSNALACGCGNRPINGKGMNGVIYFGGQLFTHYIDHNPVESDFIYSKSYRYNSKTLSSLGVPYLSFALSRRWRFDKYFTTFSWLAAVVGTHKIFYQFGSFRANINLWQNDE